MDKNYDLIFLRVEPAANNTYDSITQVRSALYKRNEWSNWDLVSHAVGEEASSAILKTVTALGVAYRSTNRIQHLVEGAEWRETVPDSLMENSTLRQIVETEIANLNRVGNAKRESAGYNGAWDDGGASRFFDRAEAMQYVLDLFDSAQDEEA